MLDVWQGNLSPSVTDTISSDGTPVDLTGATVAFRMRLASDSALVVDHAASVIDPAAGTVRYDWNTGDTDTNGIYAFWWSVTFPSGDEQDTPEADLVIREHAVADNALCTLSDVHVAMETPLSDTSLDDVIIEYIGEASDLIIKQTRREFAPVSTATTRRFNVNNQGRIILTPYDLQTPTLVLLHPESSQYTIQATDYQLEPFVNSEGVYTAVRISPWIPRVSLRSLKFGDAWCDITGTWGFPSVPPSVKRAAVITVRTWVRRDAQAIAGNVGGNYYSGQELTPQPQLTYALPAAARKLLAPYQRSLGAV